MITEKEVLNVKITKDSKFLAISGTYETYYGGKSYNKTLLFPVEWFQVEDLEAFAKSIEIELSFGEIEGKHSDCHETGFGSIVDLSTALKLARETVEDGYDYDEWTETEQLEVFDELFNNHEWKFFDDFREEFKKVLKEQMIRNVRFEVFVPVDKQEEFEQFLKTIGAADFNKL